VSRDPSALGIASARAHALAEAGHVQVREKNWEKAIAFFQESLALEPGKGLTWGALAYALEMSGRPEDAVAAYGSALALLPDTPAIAFNLGNVLRKLERLDEAEGAYRRALGSNPRHAPSWNNLGLVLHMRGRPDDAIACYGRALGIDPGYAEALNNQGSSLVSKNEIVPALEAYARALAVDPGLDRARFNQGVAHLLRGDFAQGWRGYEFRVRPPWIGALCGVPWDGKEPLAGKTVVIPFEQGLGDTIHFARYAERVANLGARVVLQVQPALKRLLASVPGVSQVVSAGEPLPAHDTYCPMMSLPYVLGSTPEGVPAHVPYVRAPGELLDAWRSKLGGGAPRVGIAWSGNPGHHLDKWRSLPLALLLKATEGIPLELFRIQRDIGPRDAAVLRSTPAIRDCTDDFADFADSAALVSQLDLVISVDTSVAHLAGALGKPLWVLLPYAPDWRWMLARTDSPWYPTARLFRQSQHGDWASVLTPLRQALVERFGGSMVPGAS